MTRRALSLALRTVAGLLVGAATLVVLLALGLWWWSGTEGSLDWTLRRLARSHPFTAEGVTGSLREGLRVKRLVWRHEGLVVEARDVYLEWKASALVTRTVELRQLQASSVVVTDQRPKTGEPMAPPQSLALPMRVTADRVAVRELAWTNGMKVQASDFAGGYAFSGLGHTLRLDNVRVAQGRYRGEVELGALGEMRLKARLQGTVQAAVPGGESIPLLLDARATGPLRRLDVRASLQGPASRATDSTPRATVTAQVSPFAGQPLPEADARFSRIDLAALWPAAPQTLLTGTAHVKPTGQQAWEIAADLENAAPGPWDQGKLPAQRLRAAGEWRGSVARIRDAVAKIGGGELRAHGRWEAGAWTVDATLDDIDPAALHTALAPMTVGGKAELRQGRGGIDFDVDLRGRAAPARKPHKGAKPGDVATALQALQVQELVARGRWADGTVTLPSLRVKASDAQLQGSLTAQVASRTGKADLQLTAPGLQGSVKGDLGATRGGGVIALDARDLAQAHRWLQTLPGVPSALSEGPQSGQAQLRLAWQGGWQDPVVQASLTAPALQWGAGAEAWTVRDATATVNGRLRDAQIEARAQARQGGREATFVLAGRGGQAGTTWRVAVSQLQLALLDPALATGAGAWRLQSRTPFEAQWSLGRLTVSAGEATLTAPDSSVARGTSALLAWEPVRWGGGELQTRGRLSGLPMGWIALFGGTQWAGAALTGDMVFDAQWDASLGATVRLDALLRRVSGDITVLAENDEGLTRRVPAGARDASLRVLSEGERVTATLVWDSERAGQARGELVSRLSSGGAGGWRWAADAPLQGRLRAQLPRLAIWSLLAPPGWRLRGSLSTDLTIAGTRAQPRLAGNLDGDDLALRSVVDGVELRDGRLRARLEGDRLRVDEFTLRGAGEGSGGGTLEASGEGRWTANGPELVAAARLSKLRASIRTDRRLTVSGNLAARVTPQGTDISGRVVADEARLTLPEESAPRLGEDVYVRNAPGQMATADERKRRPPAEPQRERRPLKVAVELDLGDDFRVQGQGVDTRLAGKLELTAQSITEPRLNGTVRTVGGYYRAYGQRLDIERGVLRFTGPVDNPALDVLAVRPRLEERVGVMITGRAQTPLVRLHSEPDLPDAQKLALLVTGRSAPAGGGEAALVQQAAMALLAQRSGGATGGGIAGKLGLEELSLRRGSEGAVLGIGKRFSDRFYASFERSLSGALGTLYIFYDVSRRVKLRAETGERSAIDLIFTTSW